MCIRDRLRGGFAGSLQSPVDWYTGFAVSGYTKRANHWVAGVEYLLKNYGYRGTFVPRAQFTAEGGYYLKMCIRDTAYRVELPEVFTLTRAEYEALHSTWAKAVRVLPNYSICLLYTSRCV